MSNAIEALEQALHLEKPVSFKEFVQGKNYCNNSEIYDYWIEQGDSLNPFTSELILKGSLGNGKCQRGDAYILTSEGIRRLDTLVPFKDEDKSESTDISVFIEGETEKLSSVYSSGVKDSIIFNMSDGTQFECSYQHPFKVWDNSHKFEWKQAKDIKVGDLFKVDLTPMPIKAVRNPKVITFDTIRDHYQDKECWDVDEDFGYFWGLMAGDGTYSSGISFMSSDDQLIEWVKGFLNQEREQVNKRQSNLRVLRLQWLNPLCKLLGIKGETSETKKPFKVLLEAPFAVQVAYVQGLMDTDGTVDRNGHCEIELSSIELIKFVKAVTNGLGLDSRIIKGHSSKSYRLYFSCDTKNKILFRLNRKLERVRDSYNSSYAKHAIELVGLADYLKREKKEKGIRLTREQWRELGSFHTSKAKLNNESWKFFSNNFRSFGLGSEVELDNATVNRVESISYGRTNLYDLTNPISHSYRANGVVSHNTSFSNYWAAYRVYRLFLEGTPQKVLHLSADTVIYGLYFSVSLKMAEKSGFKQLYNIFKNCKWFKDNYPINTDKKSSIEFPNNFVIDYASAEGHAIGLTVWLVILDEGNFRRGVGLGMAEEYEEVTQLYQELMDRLMSRFSRPDGTIDALAILISSASYQTAFVEKRSELVKNDPNSKIISSAAYEVKPWQYSKEKFEVFIGAGNVEPCIVESEEQKQAVLKMANVLGTGEEDQFIRKVPVNLKKSFQTGIYLALQNHCGIPTHIQGQLMSNLKYLKESYVDEKMIPPVLQSFELQASNADDTQLIEFLVPENIVNPDYPHVVFLDLSVQSDNGGLSIWRYDGKENGDENGKDLFTRVALLSIKPPQFPAATSITKVQQFIIDLAEYFNIVAFSSDQYQCLTLDTLIPTDKGIKAIKDVNIGDILFSYEGKTRVVNKFLYKKVPVYEVRTKKGVVIKMTRNHRISTVKWVTRKGDFDVVKYGIYRHSKLIREFKFPEVGDNIERTPCLCNDNYQILPEYVVLGWMLGDGGITNGNPYCIFSKAEIYILKEFEKIKEFSWCHADTDKDCSSYTLRFKVGDKHLKTLLRVFGNRCAAQDKFVPFELLDTKSKALSFLRGLYSADGSCTKEQVVLSSSSIKLLRGVKKLMSVYLGIKTNIIKGKRGYKGDFGTNIEYHLRSIGNVSEFLKVGFIQEYKNQNLKQAATIVGKGDFDKVVSVEPCGIETVVDLEVDNRSHSYYTCDLLSHNSEQLRQEIADALNVDNIRMSIDSSDQPYIAWARALVDGQIKQTRSELLEKEVQEAVHDYKRHRVIKPKGATDDILQVEVGGFWLCQQFGKDIATVDGLYSNKRINIVGTNKYKKIMNQLGYQAL